MKQPSVGVRKGLNVDSFVCFFYCVHSVRSFYLILGTFFITHHMASYQPFLFCTNGLEKSKTAWQLQTSRSLKVIMWKSKVHLFSSETHAASYHKIKQSEIKCITQMQHRSRHLYLFYLFVTATCFPPSRLCPLICSWVTYDSWLNRNKVPTS